MQCSAKEIEPGVWLVDKPTGVTSHDVVDEFRRRTGEKHVGHAGTLDPLATGALIILVGRAATKRQDEFLHTDKLYQVAIKFGMTTDTYDRDGKTVSTTPWATLQHLTEAQLRAALPPFTGEISQQVPAFSAVRVDGHKLYELAHQGKVLPPLPVRTVTICAMTLKAFEKDATTQSILATLEVRCGAGTYIRSLIHDLGHHLGVGATVAELRRLAIGSYMLS